MANEVKPVVEVMLPPTDPACWICRRTLVATTDGMGRQWWTCPPCRGEIEAMQEELKRLLPRAVVKGPPRVPAKGTGPSQHKVAMAALRARVLEEWRKKPRPTLKEIGAAVGRTGERVRQMLVEAGEWKVNQRGEG